MKNDYLQKRRTIELHSELNKDDRAVLKAILMSHSNSCVSSAFVILCQKYSPQEIEFSIDDGFSEKIEILYSKAPTNVILAYIEHLLEACWRNSIFESHFKLLVDTFETFFVIRGLLYKLHDNGIQGVLEVVPIASPEMEYLDNETRALLCRKGWTEQAEKIRSAQSYIKKGEGSYGIALEEIYIALETGLKKTCEELLIPPEKYTNLTITPIVNILKGKGIFDGMFSDYSIHFATIVTKLAASLGGKRKTERHKSKIKIYEVLYFLYAIDNILCFLVNKLEEIESSDIK